MDLIVIIEVFLLGVGEGAKLKFRMITSQQRLVKLCFVSLDQEKVSDYEMKLMDLDVEQLGIPVSSGSNG